MLLFSVARLITREPHILAMSEYSRGSWKLEIETDETDDFTTYLVERIVAYSEHQRRENIPCQSHYLVGAPQH